MAWKTSGWEQEKISRMNGRWEELSSAWTQRYVQNFSGPETECTVWFTAQFDLHGSTAVEPRDIDINIWVI